MHAMGYNRRNFLPLFYAVTAATSGFLAISSGNAAQPGNPWSQVLSPTPGPAQIIGSFARGCISGAVPLPIDGPGYSAIRLSRRRNFGHPDLVDFIESLGRHAQAAGLPLFYVGDMGQPRGGPLPFGHASHQIGLDVDIWFTTMTRPGLPIADREEPPLPSMLFASLRDVDPSRFDQRQVHLLKLAAADPRVERIFVNPVIKLALCHGYAGATDHGTGWLHRLSPWYGHDDHFHVRLRCPDSSPSCEPQKPVPDGDGCDASLASWARSQRPPPVVPTPVPVVTKPPPPRVLPAACSAVLEQH
jgi:penicillin-insensitive murein endopeptidase